MHHHFLLNDKRKIYSSPDEIEKRRIQLSYHDSNIGNRSVRKCFVKVKMLPGFPFIIENDSRLQHHINDLIKLTSTLEIKYEMREHSMANYHFYLLKFELFLQKNNLW